MDAKITDILAEALNESTERIGSIHLIGWKLKRQTPIHLIFEIDMKTLIAVAEIDIDNHFNVCAYFEDSGGIKVDTKLYSEHIVNSGIPTAIR